jgi:transposase
MPTGMKLEAIIRPTPATRPGKHHVALTERERTSVRKLTTAGVGAARALTHARILLQADSAPGGLGWADEQIHAAWGVSLSTIVRVRRAFATRGLEAALHRQRARRVRRRVVDGEREAHLVALACSTPPDGRERWTLRLLAERFVTLETGVPVSHETVRRVLGKNELKPWLRRRWCIPPEQNAAFVCQMEDVLEVYTRPYDPRSPQVCMDETSTQLVADTRPPLPAAPGRVAREDYEYARRGVANLFLFVEPLRGRRHVRVTDRRTKQDWAAALRELADVHYPEAERIVLVLDNLNTHGPASFYEAFPPAEARRLATRFDFHYTPKHGSWLNMAEIELSVLDRQCLDRRIPDVATLTREVAAWVAARTAARTTIDWRFTTADARIKLKRLYPSLGV